MWTKRDEHDPLGMSTSGTCSENRGNLLQGPDPGGSVHPHSKHGDTTHYLLLWHSGKHLGYPASAVPTLSAISGRAGEGGSYRLPGDVHLRSSLLRLRLAEGVCQRTRFDLQCRKLHHVLPAVLHGAYNDVRPDWDLADCRDRWDPLHRNMSPAKGAIPGTRQRDIFGHSMRDGDLHPGEPAIVLDSPRGAAGSRVVLDEPRSIQPRALEG